MTGSVDYHLERHRKHKKWGSRHFQSAVWSLLSIVGIPCLAIFIPKWLSHRRKAKKHKRLVEEKDG